MITIPYYADQNVLKKGLHNFSVEAGFVRENFGIESDDYDQPLIAGTDDYGVTNWFTSEIHSEMTSHIQTAGLGGNVILGNYGVLTLAAAGSYNKASEIGGLMLLKFSHTNAMDWFNYGFSTRVTSQDYTAVRSDVYQREPKMQNQVYVGLPNFLYGSLAISYTQEINRNGTTIIPINSTAASGQITQQKDIDQLSINYSVPIAHRFALSLSAMTNIHGEKNRAIYLSLTTSLGHGTTASFTGNHYQQYESEDTNQQVATIEKSLPLGSGFGYKLSASHGNQDENQFINAGVSAQNKIGTYSIEAAHYPHGKTEYQGQAQGSLVFMHNQLIPSRNLYDQSFALVKVGDYSKIPVYFDNQEVAKTNSKGYAFIPNIYPYQENNISIKPEELPLTAKIDEDKLTIIPYYRSGIFVPFNIYRAINATLTAKLPNGEFVPMGTLIKLNGKENDVPVGMDGLVYLSKLKMNQNNKVTLEWIQSNKDPKKWESGTYEHAICSFNVYFKETEKADTQLGEFTCKPKITMVKDEESG